MRGEKQLEAAAVPIRNWILSIIYVGKSTLFHDRQQERLKLIVSSSAPTNQQEYMYTFEVGNNLADIDIKVQQAKDFKTLKEFFYYLKFNGQSIQFREVSGEGLLSVQYPNKRKEKPIAHIKGGLRLTVESNQAKIQRFDAIKKLEIIEKKTLQAQKKDNQEPSYNPETTLVVDHIDKIRTIVNGVDQPTQQAFKVKKIVLKYCQLDVNSPECEMKNDRQIDRIAMQKILNLLPKLQQMQEISVQWHKLSTSKAIEDVLKACEKLPQLRVINFDNQGNAFDKSFFKTINQSKQKYNYWQKLEEISCFFNISDEDDYFQESWWHPQHTEKYKGKDPIEPQQWEAFANVHKNLNSVWIPRNGDNDIRLLAIRSWKKLALGYYQDQRMNANYWNAMKEICESRGELSPNRLISLCLTRIKDIDDEALSIIITNNSYTLQNFTLCWCDNETDEGLQPLAVCDNIKSISIRHSPLQENINVTCSFLSSPAMKNLRSLYVQNFKKAKDNILKYLQSDYSSNLRSLSLPRNEWVGQNIWDRLGNREKLIKLNLYNNKLLVQKDYRPFSQAIKKMKMLRVLNIGAPEIELLHMPEILAQLPRIRKLNISDRKTSRNISKNFYENNWSRICYPTIDKDTKKPYEKLDNNQKKEFLLRISNQEITNILEKLPRATHLDIRNLGGDERPFANLKLAPNIRFIGCEFELYKQIQGLDRRGITFV